MKPDSQFDIQHSKTASLASLAILLALPVAPAAAAAPTTVYAAGWGGTVVESTNGGLTWNTISPNLGPIYSLAIDPTNSSVIYAGVYGGVYKTSNGGGNWTEYTDNIQNTGSQVNSIVIDPSNPATVYAGLGGLGTGGVFKSIDGGVHWKAINNGLQTNGILSVLALAIDPLNNDTVYVTGNTGLVSAKSTDGGSNWTSLTGSVPFGFAIAINPVQTSTLFMSGPFEVAGSTNGGATWTSVLGGDTIFESLAIDPSAPTTIYTGTSLCSNTTPACVYKSTDGGVTWVVSGMLTGTEYADALVIDPANTSTLYAGTKAGVYQSPDGGVTWNLSYSTDMVTSLAMKPNTTQNRFFVVAEAAVKDVIAAVQGIHNTTIDCDLLQASVNSTQALVKFGLLSASQGQALINQLETAMQAVPCQ